MVDADVLAIKCTEATKRVCTLCAPLRYAIQFANGHSRITDAEWQHLGSVASFMAFVQLGGNPDLPEQFDWLSDKYLRLCANLLQGYTLGRNSDSYDQMRRDRSRRPGALVQELRWTAWTVPSSRTAYTDETGLFRFGKETRSGKSQNDCYYDFCEQADRVEIAEEVALELTRVLRPQEAVWLIRRYRDGETTAALAEELIKKNAKYQTDGGLLRAIRYIDVVVHRAKKKARAKLAPMWRAIAEEVAL